MLKVLSQLLYLNLQIVKTMAGNKGTIFSLYLPLTIFLKESPRCTGHDDHVPAVMPYLPHLLASCWTAGCTATPMTTLTQQRTVMEMMGRFVCLPSSHLPAQLVKTWTSAHQILAWPPWTLTQCLSNVVSLTPPMPSPQMTAQLGLRVPF